MKKKNDDFESALSAEPANESIATSKRERVKSIAYAAILTAAEAAEKAAAFFRCVFMVSFFLSQLNFDDVEKVSSVGSHND